MEQGVRISVARRTLHAAPRRQTGRPISHPALHTPLHPGVHTRRRRGARSGRCAAVCYGAPPLPLPPPPLAPPPRSGQIVHSEHHNLPPFPTLLQTTRRNAEIKKRAKLEAKLAELGLTEQEYNAQEAAKKAMPRNTTVSNEVRAKISAALKVHQARSLALSPPPPDAHASHPRLRL